MSFFSMLLRICLTAPPPPASEALDYGVKVYLPCYIRLNTEGSQAVQEILTHGGPEVIFNEFKLTEAPFH